jgi:hypothetical protein
MTVKRNIACKGVIGDLRAGFASAILPVSVAAQTVGNDPIKQLQDQIRKIQKEYQSQIRGLQKQLDDLKAAQAAPKTPPPPQAGQHWRCRRRAATGSVNEDTKLAGYFESDFQSAATTSNSVESNSYNPRLRQAYATLDKQDWGTYFLGGQTWSLLTMFNEDMTPRRENIPLTIDGQYAVGFT